MSFHQVLVQQPQILKTDSLVLTTQPDGTQVLSTVQNPTGITTLTTPIQSTALQVPVSTRLKAADPLSHLAGASSRLTVIPPLLPSPQTLMSSNILTTVPVMMGGGAGDKLPIKQLQPGTAHPARAVEQCQMMAGGGGVGGRGGSH